MNTETVIKCRKCKRINIADTWLPTHFIRDGIATADGLCPECASVLIARIDFAPCGRRREREVAA
jgi:hypothetical protein